MANQASDSLVTDPAAQTVLPDLTPINLWCRTHLKGFDDFVSIAPIGEGYSNPTYRVETERGISQVLRAMPVRRSAPSAHRIDREFKVMRALAPTAIPVPRMIAYCADPIPAGTPFFLMEHVEGVVFSGGALPAPKSRQRLLLELARHLGVLHTLDYRSLGLATFSRSGKDYIRRQIETMTRLYRATELDRLSEMEELIALLSRFAPQSTTCLLHGDFRLGNVVVAPDLRHIAAVLDWELSTLGDPLSDIAYCTLMYHWDSPVFGSVIGINDGVPDEQAFIAAYCAAAGLHQLPALGLYQAFSLFRLACITQAALHREATGDRMRHHLPEAHHPAAVARLALRLAGSELKSDLGSST